MNSPTLPANTDAQKTIEADAAKLLGPPPILRTEDAGTYQAFCDRLEAALAPNDFLETIWMRDIAAMSWEALRLRRAKAAYHDYHSAIGFKALLLGVKDGEKRKRLLEDFSAQGSATANRRANKYIASVNGQDVIDAETLVGTLDEVERLDRLILQAESRRNAVVRELDRHRDAVAVRRLRQVVEEIADAEFEDVSASDQAAAQ